MISRLIRWLPRIGRRLARPAVIGLGSASLGYTIGRAGVNLPIPSIPFKPAFPIPPPSHPAYDSRDDKIVTYGALLLAGIMGILLLRKK